MLKTTINGTEYELSTRLRVAFRVQGCHNHKPYADVFKSIGEMSLEDQIEIIFESFKDANPSVAGSMNKQEFLNYYLDNFKLKQVMDQLQGIIKGIMGDESEDVETPVEEGN